MTEQVWKSNPHEASVYPTSLMTSRMISGISTYAVVEISPATKAMPVVRMVSQATRQVLSWPMIASRMPSEIWSAILSGCPSVTDSEVKRKVREVLTRNSLLAEMQAPETEPLRHGAESRRTKAEQTNTGGTERQFQRGSASVSRSTRRPIRAARTKSF